MEEVTAETLRESFPHGAAVYYNEFRPVFDVVGLEFIKDEGKVLALGFAYPNKDFVFDLTSPEETPHGWWVKTLEGVRCFWTPLSSERGTEALDRMGDV